jgi:hypothetical protein
MNAVLMFFGVWAGLFYRHALGDFQLDTAVFAAGIIIISGIEWLKFAVSSGG